MKVFIYLWIIGVSMIVISCRTKEGAPGPAGTSGVNGVNGSSGSSGEDALNKQGSVTGTIRTVNASNDSIFIPFEFAYYESIAENTYQFYKPQTPYFTFNMKRRTLKEAQSYCTLLSTAANDTLVKPTSINVEFSFVEAMSNNSYFIFTAAPTTLTEPNAKFPDNASIIVSAYSFDFTTGKMAYNFIINYPVSTTSLSKAARVQGSVNVTLNKKVQF